MRTILTRAIKDFPYKLLSKFKNLDPKNAISLFCDPRGGSTWLAETLACIPNTLLLNEPLHLKNVKSLWKINFGWRQYIPENAQWEEAKIIIESFLKGNKLNYAVCSLNTIPQVIWSNQTILKFIRGKALLPWYVNQFDLKFKPLVLVRHPFAVVSSASNHPAWNYNFKKFELPDCPFNCFYKSHAKFLKTLQTKEEQLVALWCMTNNVVLNHPKNDISWISINYENLVAYPLENFQMIFKRWNLKIPEILSDQFLKPSSSTFGKQIIRQQELITGWKKQLNTEQISRLQNVLDYFEIDYYGTEFTPLIPANEVHLKKAKP